MLREDLMPIGRFARSCRLTVKALRHYDEEGLLLPAQVDWTTGYRYYARSQAREAVAIAMLRALDVGVATIRAILSAKGDARTAILEAEVVRLGREIQRKERALKTIARLVREGDLLPYEVAHREAGPVRVARRSRRTTTERLVPDTTELVYSLFDELRDAGGEVRDPILCMNEEHASGEEITVHRLRLS